LRGRGLRRRLNPGRRPSPGAPCTGGICRAGLLPLSGKLFPRTGRRGLAWLLPAPGTRLLGFARPGPFHGRTGRRGGRERSFPSHPLRGWRSLPPSPGVLGPTRSSRGPGWRGHSWWYALRATGSHPGVRGSGRRGSPGGHGRRRSCPGRPALVKADGLTGPRGFWHLPFPGLGRYRLDLLS